MAKRKLERRERIAVVAGAVIVSIAILTPLMKSYWNVYKKSETNLVAARGRLEEVKLWRQQIEAERSGREAVDGRIKARGPRFNLYTFASNGVRKRGLESKAQIENKRSIATGGRLSEVQITLTSITMAEFVELLHDLYASDNLIILRKLDYLKVSRTGKGLDCRLSFLAPTA